MIKYIGFFIVFKYRLHSDCFLFIFISTTFIFKFSIYFCSNFLCLLGLFFFTNPDDLPHQLIRIREGLLYHYIFVSLLLFLPSPQQPVLKHTQ
jgi:hypothetical protein